MRRRILLLCAALLVAGFVVRPVAETLLSVWWDISPVWCTPGPDSTNIICRQLFRRPSIPIILAMGFVVLFLLAASYPVIRWCLRPLHDLVPVIDNVGPQNLGHRLRPGDGRDELAVLGRSIDGMMDRIAVGYEAQRRFAADASHELRTPLAVQRTLIEVGLARTLKEGQLELLAAQLLETNERNERLIEGLLVLSESDRGLVSRTPLRLDRITAGVLDAHRTRAGEAGVTITSELAPRVVAGEQVLLERLVTNLVQNAIKYNRPGGTIDVRVGDDPALSVVNTGDDVPPDEVPALFEPFRRLHGSRIDHSGGAGLGLAIARSITRAHDGIIAASSTGRDGLSVQVSFPAPTAVAGR
ncbi:ATP-binding protein [Actinoplanes sp. TRM 88003]|uniref:histidine kinase n=1 Tax=Paractinoplanes aksuensis TaxID=2939490 RepID=A0ABT1DSS4_9ACTN|nr:ATP-binding protein [Actinoplanes aksuensis]MCO8272771.1 ATP-binding protein [Actinoplanes aksuensis]